MGEVITSVDQVGPAWLTSVLTRGGALTRGTVDAVGHETEDRRLSNLARLRVSYSSGSSGRRPARLLLKMVNADLGGDSFGPSEVDYYIRDYVGLVGAPLVACHDAAWSGEQRRYHVLMDDLSSTHADARDKAPTLGYGLALAEALALMHAHWWGGDQLAELGEPIPSDEVIERYVDVARQGLAPMLDSCRDALEPTWPAAIIEMFENHPRAMVDRTGDTNGFTLVHGDVNPTNILAPIVGDRPVFLIDRQPFDWSLKVWLGVSDIAYMMVHWWEPETRRRLELPILERYHRHLEFHGVTGYSWERLLADYKLAAAQSVYVATEWCRGVEERESLRWLWLPMLKRSMVAFFDLGCDQLWRRSG